MMQLSQNYLKKRSKCYTGGRIFGHRSGDYPETSIEMIADIN
jgi:hypothetical protein